MHILQAILYILRHHKRLHKFQTHLFNIPIDILQSSCLSYFRKNSLIVFPRFVGVFVAINFISHVTWPSWSLRSSVLRLFVHQTGQGNNRKDVKRPHYWFFVRGIPQWRMDSIPCLQVSTVSIDGLALLGLDICGYRDEMTPVVRLMIVWRLEKNVEIDDLTGLAVGSICC